LRKLNDGGVDGFLLDKKFPADIISLSYGERDGMGILTGRQPAINTADKIQHGGISSSIHYMYFSSSMSSKSQCAVISARSSSDLASANVSSFSCLLHARASS
jgi:hypothetical protein